MVRVWSFASVMKLPPALPVAVDDAAEPPV
jgi:hypothetical protein